MNKRTAPTLELKNLHRRFKQGSQTLDVLRGVNLDIEKGEIVALIGPSGSGKSTMLQIAGLLEQPTKGEIYLDGQRCSKLNDTMRTILRRDYLGFVYQYHNLLADFDATENVMLPQLISGISPKLAREKSEWLLKRLGLEKRLKHRPAEMSGGEQQRTAVARSLANNPEILLADEPTGSLDPAHATAVFDLLLDMVRKNKMALLLVTHDMALAARADRTITIENGIVK